MLDYFEVSITGSAAVYEEIDSNGASRFTDVSGVTIEVAQPVAYQLRSWVLNRLPWMEPLPIAPAVLEFTQLQFLNRFTVSERIGIRAAAKTNPVIEDIMALFDSVSIIHTDAQQTIDSIGYFVSQALLTQVRANEILGIA